jgi:hypothetical protein
MAKVKGPLMSMGASGQLGKTLVFMTWKGIKDVRAHVVPANPKTQGQRDQRDIMKAAVLSWHTNLFNELDVAAYNILASIQAKIMSGFNIFCKLFIDQTLLETTLLVPHGMVISANTGGSFSISCALAGVTAIAVKYGSSPSVLGNGVQLEHASEGNPYTKTLTGFTAGDYVYFQIYTGVSGNSVLSGIYKVLVLA